MRPHPRRARTNPQSPRAWGTCDRSGFIANQEDLQWQMQWGGTRLINLRILVAPDQYDIPQEQLKALILPPDPVAILNARPEPYAMDEETYRLTQSGIVRLQMDGTQRIESNAQSTIPLTQEAGLFLTDDGPPAFLTI